MDKQYHQQNFPLGTESNFSNSPLISQLNREGMVEEQPSLLAPHFPAEHIANAFWHLPLPTTSAESWRQSLFKPIFYLNCKNNYGPVQVRSGYTRHCKSQSTLDPLACYSLYDFLWCTVLRTVCSWWFDSVPCHRHRFLFCFFQS